MSAKDTSPLDTRIVDTYRRQMLEMYRQAAPSPSAETEENWLDTRYPQPDIERDKEAITTPTPPEMVPDSTPTPAPDASNFVGYLRVYAFTGSGAEPIEGARVIVTRAEDDTQSIYANLTTDRDGFTPVIALPSVDPALTLRPGNPQPYVPYTIRITADGFQTAEHRNVPVYGDNYVTQPVAMLPVMVGSDTNDTQEFISGGPTNL